MFRYRQSSASKPLSPTASGPKYSRQYGRSYVPFQVSGQPEPDNATTSCYSHMFHARKTNGEPELNRRRDRGQQKARHQSTAVVSPHTPDHGPASTAGFHRPALPSGARAYGKPRNAAMGVPNTTSTDPTTVPAGQTTSTVPSATPGARGSEAADKLEA